VSAACLARLYKLTEKQGYKWWHSPPESVFTGHRARFRWTSTRTHTHSRDAATGTECQTTSTAHVHAVHGEGKRRKSVSATLALHGKGRKWQLALEYDSRLGRSMWVFATLQPEPSSRAHLRCRQRPMLGGRFDKYSEKQGWHSPTEGDFNGHRARFSWPATRICTYSSDAATGTECQATSTTR
jgi:hypothetical protein